MDTEKTNSWKPGYMSSSVHFPQIKLFDAVKSPDFLLSLLSFKVWDTCYWTAKTIHVSSTVLRSHDSFSSFKISLLYKIGCSRQHNHLIFVYILWNDHTISQLTSTTSYSYQFGDENFLRSSLIKFQIYNTVFITIASMPYIKSPGLLYLMTESLYILIVAF